LLVPLYYYATESTRAVPGNSHVIDMCHNAP
jgi:hypothetical protein